MKTNKNRKGFIELIFLMFFCYCCQRWRALRVLTENPYSDK